MRRNLTPRRLSGLTNLRISVLESHAPSVPPYRDARAKSPLRVVDPTPRQIPAPESIQRALDLLASSQRPLIILGKGAAYAQADANIRSFIEQTGIPFLPMS